MMIWIQQYPEAAGLLPMFLRDDDERGAVEQIDEQYAHGGGWNEFDGFELTFDSTKPPADVTLHYPGDPLLHCVAFSKLRDEYVLVFEHDWCVVTKDGTEFNCARID